jgi:hypothetical protein
MASLTAHPYLPRFSFRSPARAPRRHGVASRTRPALAKGERVVVRARDARSRWRVVATPHAVYYQDHANGLRSWHRVGWEQVERVEWDPWRGELRLVSLVPEATPDLTLRLPQPGRLPDLARERVTATTLARVPLRHAGRVVGWLSGRQPAAGHGEVSWVVRLVPGIELTEAELTDDVRAVRAHLGI